MRGGEGFWEREFEGNRGNLRGGNGIFGEEMESGGRRGNLWGGIGGEERDFWRGALRGGEGIWEREFEGRRGIFGEGL